MEEKVIIEGKVGGKGILKPLLFFIFFAVLIAILIFGHSWIGDYRWDVYDTNYSLYSTLGDVRNIIEGVTYFMMIPAAICLLYVVVLILIPKCEITVTSHRVYGGFRKEQVVLPLDSITAVKRGRFKSIVVASSAGKVACCFLKEQKEIYDAVTALLIERQNKHEAVGENKSNEIVDQLNEYKSLMESGIITQEQFEAKKKKLLGI